MNFIEIILCMGLGSALTIAVQSARLSAWKTTDTRCTLGDRYAVSKISDAKCGWASYYRGMPIGDTLRSKRGAQKFCEQHNKNIKRKFQS